MEISVVPEAGDYETWIGSVEWLYNFVLQQKYIWTSGRLCDFKGCDRPDLQPVSVNGWWDFDKVFFSLFNPWLIRLTSTPQVLDLRVAETRSNHRSSSEWLVRKRWHRRPTTWQQRTPARRGQRKLPCHLEQFLQWRSPLGKLFRNNFRFNDRLIMKIQFLYKFAARRW